MRMVAKGKSLSRQGYDVELTSVKSVIALQHKPGGGQMAQVRTHTHTHREGREGGRTDCWPVWPLEQSFEHLNNDYAYTFGLIPLHSCPTGGTSSRGCRPSQVAEET